MPRITYVKKNLRGDRLAIINTANNIITAFQNQGFTLTLRQLYYRFVADDLFPATWVDPTTGSKNNIRNYKKLGDILGDGRMAGLVDWDAIEDRTRELAAIAHWNSPHDIVNACAGQFKLDKWTDQSKRLEVWVEKDALEGIVKQASHSRDVSAFSCRGYGSLSSLWEAARRLKGYVMAGQAPVILHLGDHDPSGIDMTRDIRDRLNQFLIQDWMNEEMSGDDASRADILDHMEEHCGGRGIEVRRIALTMDQITEYNPPPNPAKTTDARYKSYEEIYGTESWELDALQPNVLTALITDTIAEYMESGKYNKRATLEQQHRNDLAAVASNWDGVSSFLGKVKKKK